MKDNQIRVVVDTNLWISFLIGKTLSDLADALISDDVKLLFSNELLDELVEVLQRPKFKFVIEQLIPRSSTRYKRSEASRTLVQLFSEVLNKPMRKSGFARTMGKLVKNTESRL